MYTKKYTELNFTLYFNPFTLHFVVKASFLFFSFLIDWVTACFQLCVGDMENWLHFDSV